MMMNKSKIENEVNSREEKNSKAYQDVLDCKEPSSPNDPVYMEYFNSWKSLDPSRYDDGTSHLTDDDF